MTSSAVWRSARTVSYTHLTQKGNGILEGKEYVVTWALGHLVTLADPEEYDKKYMKWDMETLPMMPDKMKLVVIRQTSKQYQAVKTQLFRKDIGDIIIATLSLIHILQEKTG